MNIHTRIKNIIYTETKSTSQFQWEILSLYRNRNKLNIYTVPLKKSLEISSSFVGTLPWMQKLKSGKLSFLFKTFEELLLFQLTRVLKYVSTSTLAHLHLTYRRKIRLREVNAKCRHLQILTCALGSSDFPRSLCFMWFWFGLES